MELIAMYFTPQELADLRYSMKSYSKFGLDEGKSEGINAFNSSVERSVPDEVEGKKDIFVPFD